MLATARSNGLNYTFPARDVVIGDALRKFGEYSQVEIDYLLKLCLAPKGHFVDVGANIGTIALPFARQRSGWKISAYEAQRWICHLLAHNVIANGLLNIEPIHAAVGAETQIVDFPMYELGAKGNFGEVGFFTTQNPPRERVRMVRLDDVARDASLIKMDIQGFEPEALKGAGEVLRNIKPCWIAEADRNDEAKARETIRIFLESAYAVYWLYVPFVTATAQKKASAEVSLVGDFNIVALPPGTDIDLDLPQLAAANDAFPAHRAELAYLRRYGF
ncbi:MAG: FkbM family methyltransferase [Alphaproteobacteria bacterium]